MNQTEFRKWAASCRILDGATGSNLRRAGMPNGVCAEQWILEHPEIFNALQKDYLASGSELVLAPTFGANRVLLSHYGITESPAKLCERLIAVCREGVGSSCLVAGDMTTVGRPTLAEDTEEYQKLIEIYSEQVSGLISGGADLFMVETMMGVGETMAAVEAIRAQSDLPVICSMSVQSDGKCYFDGSIYEAAPILQALGADAIGVNCSAGPDQLESVIRHLKSVTDLAVLAKPNAGMPRILTDGTAEYDLSPEQFAQSMKKLRDAGATLLGGCCGTTPAHIAALRHECIAK